MPVHIRIPPALQKFTQYQVEVIESGHTIAELLNNLDSRFPGIKNQICDDSGKIRRFMNIYINDEDIRYLEGELTEIKEDDQVLILPAIAGGR